MTVYSANVVPTKLATILFSYNFATQLTSATPCVIMSQVFLNGVALYDQTMTSLSYGTTGVANTVAIPNLVPGTHQVSVRLYASCASGGAQVTTTGWGGGQWGSTVTTAFLNQ